MPESKSKIKNPRPRQAKRGGQKSQIIKKPIVKKIAKPAVKTKVLRKKAVVKKIAAKTVARKTAAGVSVPVKKSTGGINADVFNTAGRAVSKVSLPKEIFGTKVNNKLMAQAVRVYLANQRMGTAASKTRGEVTGSTRKIWRQKGTGRARHGSRKAPIFVGGGVVFGPRVRDYSLKMPQKMRRAALFSALTLKNQSGEIKIISGLEKIMPKTKNMAIILKKLGNEKKKNILLVTPNASKNGFENVYRAGRNIGGLKIVKADLVNTYEVLNNKGIILMKETIDVLKNHFLKGGSN